MENNKAKLQRILDLTDEKIKSFKKEHCCPSCKGYVKTPKMMFQCLDCGKNICFLCEESHKQTECYTIWEKLGYTKKRELLDRKFNLSIKELISPLERFKSEFNKYSDPILNTSNFKERYNHILEFLKRQLL